MTDSGRRSLVRSVHPVVLVVLVVASGATAAVASGGSHGPTGAVATNAIALDAAPNASFDALIYADERGDVADIDLSLNGTDTATVTIGSVDDVNWVQNVTVRDGDGDGSVTLEFNTYTAGTSDDTYGNGTGYVVYSVADADDSVVGVSQAGGLFDPDDPAAATLASNNYDLSVAPGNTTDNETDVATLSLNERTTSALTNHVVPGSRIPVLDSVADISELVDNKNVTEASTVASEDGLVVKVEADGLEGVLKNHTDAAYANDTGAFFAEAASAPGGGDAHAWDFGVVQTNPGPNASAYRATLNASNTRLIADPYNGTYWLVIDTDRVAEFTVGDQLETNFTTLEGDDINGDTTSVLDSWEFVAAEATVDANADIDNDGSVDEVTVRKAPGQELTGTTTVAPGTELAVKVTGTDPGSPFIKPLSTVVQADGAWSATGNFSDTAQGANFTVDVRRGTSSLLGETVDGRVLAAPPNRTISACVTINESGVYRVARNVTDSSADPCIRIRASNVILMGQGHTLDGVSGGVGREAVQAGASPSLSNVTVRNLTVTNWGTGIRFGPAGVTDSRITNVTVQNTDRSAILLRNSRGTTVAGNDLRHTLTGITVESTQSITVRDNHIENEARSGAGFVLDAVVFGSIDNNTIRNVSTGLLLANDSKDGTYAGNDIRTTEVGVRFNGASDNHFSGTVLRDSARWSVRATPAPGSSVNNTFSSPDLGLPNGSIAFTIRDARLRPVPLSAQPAPPNGKRSLGIFLNATNTSASGHLDLTVTYTDSVAQLIHEGTLTVWRNRGSWSDQGRESLDASTNTLTKNVTNFSVFAPLADAAPDFTVRITGTNSPVDAGQTINVTAEVTNMGNESGTQEVSLAVAGSERSVRNVTLAREETTTVTLSWDTARTDGGNYTATVASLNDTDATTVRVRSKANFQIRTLSTNSPVTEGEPLTATATIENTGDQAGTHSVEFWAGGDTHDTTTVPLGSGERTTVTLSWATATGDAGNYTAWVLTPHNSDSESVTVEPAPQANVAVDVTGTNSPVTEGETLEVSATVENTGGQLTTQTIQLSVGGGQRDATEVTLDPGEAQSVTLSWAPSTGNAGNYTATIASDNDSDSTGVTVEVPETTPATFALEIAATNQPVTEGDELAVSVDVRNTGDAPGTKPVDLTAGGELRDTTSVSLDPDQETTVTLRWPTTAGDAGTHTATVASPDSSASTDVTIEQPSAAFFDVTIDATNSPVTEGQELEVTATVENTGGQAATQTVALAINDTQEATTSVSLKAGESTTVALTWETGEGDAGAYPATISTRNNTAGRNVGVEAPETSGGSGGSTNAPPSVSIPAFGPQVGESVSVTPSVSDDGSITGYEWSVNGVVVGRSQTLTHIFEESGRHTVVLRVTDDQGSSVTARRVVTANAPPEVSITIGDVSLGSTTTLQADASDPDGNITGVVWTVDGQIVSRSATAEYTFTTPGSHEFTLRLTSSPA